MDGNPEGTPNPLNPVQGTASAANQPQPSTGMATGTGNNYGGYMEEPANFAEPSTPTTSSMPEMAKPSMSSSAMPNIPEAPRHNYNNGYANRSVIDPMMRPVSHTPEAQADGLSRAESSFDSFSELDNTSFDQLGQDFGQLPNNGPDLVAKDSIVEPVGGNKKKKALVACAITLIIIAIICGVAAIVVALMNNNGDDRVTKAIEKMLNGEIPSIVAANGKITSSTTEPDRYYLDDNEGIVAPTVNPLSPISTTINFDGTFDAKSSINTVSATLGMNYSDGSKVAINIHEQRNESGDVFFKVSGLGDIVKMFGTGTLNQEVLVYGDSDGTTTTEIVAGNCAEGTTDSTNCLPSSQDDTSIMSGLMTVYGSLLNSIDDQWILVSGDFSEEMENLAIFDNSTTCTIEAFESLPKYSKDFISSYKANPFIISSTDNLGIAKKKNELYKLTFDSNKMSAFINSLNNNGFINELNACNNSTATNSQVTPSMLEEIVKNLPAIYAEIDENNNFTRFYFKTTTDNLDDTSTTTEADINLSYPSEVRVIDPTDYMDMSTLLDSVLTTLLQSGTTPLLEPTNS